MRIKHERERSDLESEITNLKAQMTSRDKAIDRLERLLVTLQGANGQEEDAAQSENDEGFYGEDGNWNPYDPSSTILRMDNGGRMRSRKKITPQDRPQPPY